MVVLVRGDVGWRVLRLDKEGNNREALLRVTKAALRADMASWDNFAAGGCSCQRRANNGGDVGMDLHQEGASATVYMVTILRRGVTQRMELGIRY